MRFRKRNGPSRFCVSGTLPEERRRLDKLSAAFLFCRRGERGALAVHGGLPAGIFLDEVVEDLDGLVGLAVLRKNGRKAGDGFEVRGGKLAGEVVGLLGGSG